MSMEYIALDSRCRQVLDYLCACEDYVPMETIAAALEKNNNHINYSLLKINNLFAEQALGTIPKKRGAGVALTPKQKQWWKNFSAENTHLDYVFTQEERVSVLICQLMLDGHSFSVDTVAVQLGVSRNTIFSDMRNVKELLAGYKTELFYDTRTGYQMLGDEFVRRSLFLYHLSAITPLAQEQVFAPDKDAQIAGAYAQLLLLQKELHVEYVPGVLPKLALLLKYITQAQRGAAAQPQPLRFSNEQKQEIQGHKEYPAVCKFFSSLEENDRLYLACQLMGNRIRHKYLMEETRSQESINCAKLLIQQFERLTGLSLEDTAQLTHNLAVHFSRAIYRYKFNIALQELPGMQIRQQHSELMTLVQIAVEQLSQDIGYPIDSSETALLTGYFAAHLENYHLNISRTPVVLVVEKEPGQYEYLADVIAAEFPMLEITDIVTVEELPDVAPNYKMLLSTVPISSPCYNTLIDKEMANGARQAIFQCFMRYRLGRSVDEVDGLVERLRPYLHRDTELRVKNEIISFLMGGVYRLADILKPDYVQVVAAACNWQQAIQRSAKPLLADGTIEESYVQNMIDLISAYGSYSYICKDVYLAHAKVNGDVHRLALGLTVFQKPVLFPGEKRVQIVIVLCPMDKNSHFNAFKEMVGICSQPAAIMQMISATTSDKLWETICRYLPE